MLSNYMLFLLAARPHMLPPPAERNQYVVMCNHLVHVEKKFLESLSDRGNKDMASILRDDANNLSGRDVDVSAEHWNTRFDYKRHRSLRKAVYLAGKLIGKEREDLPTADMLDLIAQAWVGMLCYAGNKCSADSHARQLSNGGELTTLAALLVQYRQNIM